MAKKSVQLEAELDSLSEKKSTLEKRLRELKTIEKNLSGRLDDEISDVNRDRANAKSNLSYGLSGMDNGSRLTEGYEKFHQKSADQDTDLGEALFNIESEIARCEQEISACSDNMRAKKQDIANAKKAEKEAEEAKKKAAKQ